jgi:hypothetical protein
MNLGGCVGASFSPSSQNKYSSLESKHGGTSTFFIDSSKFLIATFNCFITWSPRPQEAWRDQDRYLYATSRAIHEHLKNPLPYSDPYES